MHTVYLEMINAIVIFPWQNMKYLVKVAPQLSVFMFQNKCIFEDKTLNNQIKYSLLKCKA